METCIQFGYDPVLQTCGPVEGNQGGSYLTMTSRNGLMFGVINIIGNFGTVFVDQTYWHTAIAANPTSTHIGYIIGGLYAGLPFCLHLQPRWV